MSQRGDATDPETLRDTNTQVLVRLTVTVVMEVVAVV